MLLLNIVFEILEQKMVIAIFVGGIFYDLFIYNIEYKLKDKEEKMNNIILENLEKYTLHINLSSTIA
jgi:hypothetical protein